jgi:mannosyltransferase OCH1-like enzyme
MATKPSGVSNDLMISSKKNEFIKYVIQGLKPANTGYILPYLTVMMTTGPVYLTTKYNLYPNKSQTTYI